jgi:hypothetical protein
VEIWYLPTKPIHYPFSFLKFVNRKGDFSASLLPPELVNVKWILALHMRKGGELALGRQPEQENPVVQDQEEFGDCELQLRVYIFASQGLVP